MKLIVGLGNPDKKYQKTRHNVGWMVMDLLAEKFADKDQLAKNQRDKWRDWRENKKIKALEQKLKVDSTKIDGATGNAGAVIAITLLKPLTYMNESGRAVVNALKNQPKKKLTDLAANLLIIHDDKDLLLGKIKIQINRNSAGHRGVESIIKHLGTKNFTRLRIGVASTEPKKMPDTSQFVLSPFGQEEKKKLSAVLAEACAMVEKWILIF